MLANQCGRIDQVVLALLPPFAAGFVAVSRTRDYKHNFSDILAGAVIGSMLTIFVYFLNYHSLMSEECHRPKIRGSGGPNENASSPV